MRRPVFIASLIVSILPTAAGTLEDMDLRSNVEASIRGTASTAALHLKIRVDDAVAIPEGIVRDMNQADEVVDLAAKVKGIRDVDRRGLRLESAPAADDVLAAQITRTLLELPQYASSGLRVEASQGVVTLSGPLTNASWRRELRTLCGRIDGVSEVVDRLETPVTADGRIQRALDRVFSPRAKPRFPGKVRAVAAGGVVTLEGIVPRLYDKRRAEREAWGFNGVRRVDDRLELGSASEIRVIDP